MRMGLWNVDLLFMPSLSSLLELLFSLLLKQKASRLLVWSAKFFPLYYMESRETQFFFFENTSIFRGKRVTTTHTASDFFFYVSDSFPSFLLISGERPFTSLLENVALKDKKIFKGVVTNKDFETVMGKSTTRIVVALYYPDEE